MGIHQSIFRLRIRVIPLSYFSLRELYVYITFLVKISDQQMSLTPTLRHSASVTWYGRSKLQKERDTNFWGRRETETEENIMRRIEGRHSLLERATNLWVTCGSVSHGLENSLIKNDSRKKKTGGPNSSAEVWRPIRRRQGFKNLGQKVWQGKDRQ